MAREQNTRMTEARSKLNAIRRHQRLKKMGKSPHWKKALAQRPKKTEEVEEPYVKVSNDKKLKNLRLPALLKGYTLKKINEKDPIDMVITWVDMSDPVWRNKYKKHTGGTPSWKRFRDMDELELSLASITKYMPWLRTIYVITDNQRPDYISDFPNVKVVDHSEILSEKCIKPTFNSNVIEAHMHKIPGLSEVFLWGNDDCMVGKPIKKSEWFKKGVPCVAFKRKKMQNPGKGFNRSVYNSIKFAGEFAGAYSGTNGKLLMQTHQINILTKSACKKVWEVLPNRVQDLIQCRTRSPVYSQFQFQLTASILGIHTGTMCLDTSWEENYKGIYGGNLKFGGLRRGKVLSGQKRQQLTNTKNWFSSIQKNPPALYCVNWIQPDKDCEEVWFKFKSDMLQKVRPKPKITLSPSSLHFKIIIPSYNVEKWIDKTINSLLTQTHNNFQAIFIDDCSSDDTYRTALNTIGGDKRFITVKNEKNIGVMANVVAGLKTLKPSDEDVVITLDGDDWFSHNKALETIHKTYHVKKCLVTYGMWESIPPVKSYPQRWRRHSSAVIAQNSFRGDVYRATQIRTWKYKLWKKIKDQDLRNKAGNYYSMASDVAIMLPILEMAGDRQEFISEIGYVYNQQNSNNDGKLDRAKQKRIENEIRKKTKYKKVIFPD